MCYAVDHRLPRAVERFVPFFLPHLHSAIRQIGFHDTRGIALLQTRTLPSCGKAGQQCSSEF